MRTRASPPRCGRPSAQAQASPSGIAISMVSGRHRWASWTTRARARARASGGAPTMPMPRSTGTCTGASSSRAASARSSRSPSSAAVPSMRSELGTQPLPTRTRVGRPSRHSNGCGSSVMRRDGVARCHAAARSRSCRVATAALSSSSAVARSAAARFAARASVSAGVDQRGDRGDGSQRCERQGERGSGDRPECDGARDRCHRGEPGEAGWRGCRWTRRERQGPVGGALREARHGSG